MSAARCQGPADRPATGPPRRTDFDMDLQHRHMLEKLQVWIAAAAAACVAWFAAWPLVRPWDRGGALAFVPTGDWASLAVFAGVVVAMSSAVALVTLSARPEGALLAALAGVAGFAFRSGPMRTLLWRRADAPGRLFADLAIEMAAMTAVLAASALAVTCVRALLKRLLPRWAWSEPNRAPGGRDGPRRKTARGQAAMHVAGCLVMQMAVALICLVHLFRSTDRGQIAFALAGSFLLGSLIAHQVFPIRATAVLWAGPLIMGMAVYGLGAGASADGADWLRVLMVGQGVPIRAALPVDWLALGAGGAVGGFWISRRIHEAREAAETAQAAKAT